jgi:hypothetical protein
MPVAAIVRLADLVDYLRAREDAGAYLAAIEAYRDRYGI